MASKEYHKEYHKEWAKKNKDKIRKIQKRYLENNSTLIAERNSIYYPMYYKKNKLKIKERNWVYYRKNKKIILEKNKEWCRQNKDILKDYKARPDVIEKNKIREISRNMISTSGKSCENCGKKTGLHIHHLNYKDPFNVMILCVQCHHEWHKKDRLKIIKR